MLVIISILSKMKIQAILITVFFLFVSLLCNAKGYKLPEYNLYGAGQGTNGSYLVKVTGIFKDAKNRQDELKMCAVHGVMFRGFGATNGLSTQSPLVSNPNVEDTKADFFNAFFSEGKYRNFCTLRESSMQSIKIKGGYEVSALILIDKEALIKYLEGAKIIEGFSDLW